MAATIGVLGIQGDFALHVTMLKKIGVQTRNVRISDDLEGCDGLILPGGESSTFIKLMHKNSLADPIREFASEKPVMGTCAGLIVLANHVVNGNFDTLSLLNVTVERNGYGRQVDSFIDDVDVPVFKTKPVMSGVFIRAPRIRDVGEGVESAGFHQGEVVMVRTGSILGLTFHPELTSDTRIHKYFIDEFVV